MRLCVALVCLALASCAGDSAAESDVTEFVMVDFPHTVTLKAEQALVASTGEIIDHADFINSDLVTYKNETIKIQSGCEKTQAHCRLLHICRASPQSKPEKYEGLEDVCMNPPQPTETGSIPNAETGIGFTVELNTMDGYGRFWVQEVKGFGASATVTLKYSLWGY